MGECPSDARGPQVVLITDEPMYFLGGGAKDAKPRAGYEVGVIQMEVDAAGNGTGSVAAAAKVKPGEDGVIVNDYGDQRIEIAKICARSPDRAAVSAEKNRRQRWGETGPIGRRRRRGGGGVAGAGLPACAAVLEAAAERQVQVHALHALFGLHADAAPTAWRSGRAAAASRIADRCCRP